MNQPDRPASILLIEDDVNLGYLLVENLRARDMKVELKQTGSTALAAIKQNRYDLCIIDIMLPEADGFTIAKQLKRVAPETPFLFLTARVQEEDKLHGFELGADDYITKPFSFKELYCRIQVALRRNTSNVKEEEYIIETGDLKLIPAQRTMLINGEAKKLSYREMGLLKILLEQKGKYVNRSEILKTIWGNDDYFAAKSMDVYITRIRKLLKDAPYLQVENLYGTGHRIREHMPHEKTSV